MEAIFTLNKQEAGLPSATAVRTSKRKADGRATAALLIQMASEILSASPTLRHTMNITLTDLAAANKVRRELARK